MPIARTTLSVNRTFWWGRSPAKIPDEPQATPPIFEQAAAVEPPPVEVTQVIPEGTLEAISTHTIHHIGDFAAQGLAVSVWPPSIYLRVLEIFQVTTTLPWATSLIITTLLLRYAFVTTFQIRSMKHMSNMAIHKPRIDELRENLSRAMKGTDKLVQYEAQTEFRTFMKENKIKPLAPLVPAVGQLFVGAGTFLGTLKLAKQENPVWSGETIGWITDLSQWDWGMMAILTGATYWNGVVSQFNSSPPFSIIQSLR